MKIFPKRFEIAPNQQGFLYHDHKLSRKLGPSIFRRWDLGDRWALVVLPTSPRYVVVTNQEILTKDSVALRLSFYVIYRITDGERFLSTFELGRPMQLVLAEAEQMISHTFQLGLRKKVALIDSEQLNEKRAEIDDLRSEELEAELKAFGIDVDKAQLRDITFPKNVQDLFARQLESKIRARSDLENARTAVATARAFKNAAEIMQGGDGSVRFFQYLETITKIAAKGHHTFVVGDLPGAGLPRS